MLDTLTKLHAAIPADRNASSKLDNFSRCFPTPLVRNIRLATNIPLPAFSRPWWIYAYALRKQRIGAQEGIFPSLGKILP
jgi:hypothetical protein